MTSDLVGLFREARERIAHSGTCAIYGGVNPEGPCDCDVDERFLALLAQGVEAAIHETLVSTRTGASVTDATDNALAALRAVVAGKEHP